MGKGDKKTTKGKRFRSSFGKSRLRKKKVDITPTSKTKKPKKSKK